MIVPPKISHYFFISDLFPSALVAQPMEGLREKVRSYFARSNHQDDSALHSNADGQMMDSTTISDRNPRRPPRSRPARPVSYPTSPSSPVVVLEAPMAISAGVLNPSPSPAASPSVEGTQQADIVIGFVIQLGIGYVFQINVSLLI